MKGPLLWVFAFLAAMQTFTAGSGLTGVFGVKLAGFLSLITAALQSGLVAYLGLASKTDGTPPVVVAVAPTASQNISKEQ